MMPSTFKLDHVRNGRTQPASHSGWLVNLLAWWLKRPQRVESLRRHWLCIPSATSSWLHPTDWEIKPPHPQRPKKKGKGCLAAGWLAGWLCFRAGLLLAGWLAAHRK
jgi:hypothetical protein